MKHILFALPLLSALIACNPPRTAEIEQPFLEGYESGATYMNESDITDETSHKGKKVNRNYKFSSGESFDFITYGDDVISGDMIVSSRSGLAEAAQLYEAKLKDLGLQGAMADKCTSRFAGFLWCNGFYGRKWENSIIYYEPYSASITGPERDVINSAILHIAEKTNIDFRLATSGDRIQFTNSSSGCFSKLGRVGGAQQLNLGPGCSTRGIAVHEFLHAAGMIHEHQRPDRDQYITINTSNLTAKGRDNIASRHDAADITEQSAFDYGSIMMYPRTVADPSFVISTSQPVFTLNKAYSGTVGQRTALSTLDIQTINLRY